jgi:AraC-like DNA-binding protein
MSNKSDGTVVLIEDEPAAIQRFLPLLRASYNCYFTTTGEGGIALYQKVMDQNPLVICDVNLPDKLGFEVCRAIKSCNPATYVMLLTAYNDSELRMAGLNAYADSYVDKVIGDEEFRLKVRNAFNTVQLNQAVEPPVSDAPAQCKFDNIEMVVRNRLLDYYKQPFFERDKKVCSLEAMSAFIHQSPRTFQRKMHEQVGMPYKTFQLKIRLQRGRELLMEAFSVTEIADILEFSSPSHFSRAFQEHYGMTPSKYKKHQLMG